MVWHFRKVELGLGELRSRELTSHLKYMARDRHLQVLEGDMVVEIKNFEVNKGAAAKRWDEKKIQLIFILQLAMIGQMKIPLEQCQHLLLP